MNEFHYISYAQEVIFGPGSLARLSEAIDRFGWRRVVLCSSRSLRRDGSIAAIESALGERLIAIYERTQSHVPDFQVAEALELAEQHEVEALIGIGGGSPLGLADVVVYSSDDPGGHHASLHRQRRRAEKEVIMAYNSMDYSAKDTVLDVVRTERANFFTIVDDPKNWNVQTRCTEWEVRDIVGHMIDVTEGYLSRWDMARKGESADALGLLIMGERLNENAQAFRSLPRDEAIARIKADSDKMLTTFDALTPEEWSGFLVTHPYMGPLPTFFYPAFHVMDYGVHTWDMKWGLGQKDAKLDERTAGVLVPYMFILMQYTVDQESVKGLDIEFGIKIDGDWGGQWRVHVKDGQYTYEPAKNLEGVQALFHFKDASDFVLTTFQRFPGGEATGDPKVIDQVRHMFFRI